MQTVFLVDENPSTAFEYHYPQNFTTILQLIKGKALFKTGLLHHCLVKISVSSS